MRRARCLPGLLLVLGGVACTKPAANSLVVVTVTAAPAMSTVTQLRVLAENGGKQEIELFPPANAGTPIAFTTSFALSLPKSRSGQLDLTVEALDASSRIVASGKQSVTIAVGARAFVTINLALVPGPDAGVPDTAGAPDTAPDTVRPADLAGETLPDLPPLPGDVPADLPVAADADAKTGGDVQGGDVPRGDVSGGDVLGSDVQGGDVADVGGVPCNFNGTTYQPGQSFTFNCIRYTCISGTNLLSTGTPCMDAASGGGGKPGTGGAPGTGGIPATGGAPGTGGVPATGGTTGAGGTTNTGASVSFSNGKGQGAMTGYGFVALGKADTLTDPTCGPSKTVISFATPCAADTNWSSASALCMTGSIPAMPASPSPTDYVDNWGVMMGLRATDPVGGGLGQSFTSVTFGLNGSPTSGLRATVHRKGDTDSTSYCAPMTSGLPIPFTNFVTDCYNTAPVGARITAADVANIDQIAVEVVSGSSAIAISNLCITKITFTK
jgi:hypothetical protein